MLFFIIVPAVIAFFLAFGSAKEICSKKHESFFSLISIFAIINTLTLMFILVLYTLVAYYTEIGSSERGMIFIIPTFGSIIVIVETIIASVIARSLFPSSDMNVDLTKNQVDPQRIYYKYPVSLLLFGFLIISLISVPIIVGISNDRTQAKETGQLKEKNDLKMSNAIWWSSHVATPNVTPINQLNLEDLILYKDEIPPRYIGPRDEVKLNSESEYDQYLIHDVSRILSDLEVTPDILKKSYAAKYADSNLSQFDYLYVIVLKYDTQELLKQELSVMEAKNKNSSHRVKKTFSFISNYIIVVENDVNFFVNPNESITELIREKFPEAQFSLSEKNTENSSTIASTTNSVPVLVPTSQKVSPPHTDFKIVFPNGGESIKIGSASGIGWNSGSFPKDAQLDVEIFEITGDKIIFDKNGACTNCIGGGLRSGISALSPVIGGVKSTEWKNPGITYSGERLKPGSHYVIKAVVSKTGTYEKGECPKPYPVCTVDIATDWSDGVFTLVN